MSRQFFNEMTLKDSVVYMNDMQYYFLMDHNSSIAMELALEDILYKKQKKNAVSDKKKWKWNASFAKWFCFVKSWILLYVAEHF